MNKSDKHKTGIQMYLSEKEEWRRRVPVLDGVAVSYANRIQVDEHSTGLRKEERLAFGLTVKSLCNVKHLGKPPSTRVRLVV